MYQQIAANKRKTVILLAGFVGFVWLLGWVLSRATGHPGLITVMAVFALIYAVVGYYASAAVALALSGAKPIAKADAPDLYRMVENLAITAGLPTPKIYIINDAAPNTFATGRDPNHAVVAVTTGILELLDKDELQGVIAHELSHVGNYDIRLMALVVVLVGVVTLLSHFFLRFSLFGGDDNDNGDAQGIFVLVGLALAIVAPIAATIIQLAVSRKREYLADANGALLTRYPEGLADALEKVGGSTKQLKAASPATAHLFFANPLKGKGVGGSISNLFSTHPPIADRVKRLRAMEGDANA